MKYSIKKGDVFLCIKEFTMDSGEIAFYEGKTYKAEMDNCITDEQDSKDHHMCRLNDFFEYFTTKEEAQELAKKQFEKLNK